MEVIMMRYHNIHVQLLMLSLVSALNGCGNTLEAPLESIERSGVISDKSLSTVIDDSAVNIYNVSIAQDDNFKAPSMWYYTAPLITPEDRETDRSYAQKDPSVVFHQGEWHIFMTIKLKDATRLEYISFKRWEDADTAQRTVLRLADTQYYAAPQVFFFAPHKKWYLIYQVFIPGKKHLHVSFSTTTDISDPNSWTQAQSIFRKDAEDLRPQGGLDFWVICDQKRAYLFFTSLDGKLWRMSTPLNEFPYGFGQMEIALQADIFEASHTYRLEGLNKYLTIVEANPDSNRYYKAYIAESLDGSWAPMADSWGKPFAGEVNVRPARGISRWTDNISHAELIRTGNDQTMPINPEKLQLVFQGALQAEKASGNSPVPWRIGILTPVSQGAPE
ncbi:MAG: non-reducing end alpha-L-arabinofuranosidase family hydrolase [Gammaproteobacteria bacterium]|nr:non-reducing end alpha-L-arabinofuranosidase family hydrolase [Gammaproteobacteria bacterium]